MTNLFKLMIASFTLSSVLAAAAPAAVQVPTLGEGDEISRACYDAYGRIVPCKRPKPQY